MRDSIGSLGMHSGLQPFPPFSGRSRQSVRPSAYPLPNPQDSLKFVERPGTAGPRALASCANAASGANPRAKSAMKVYERIGPDRTGPDRTDNRHSPSLMGTRRGTTRDSRNVQYGLPNGLTFSRKPRKIDHAIQTTLVRGLAAATLCWAAPGSRSSNRMPRPLCRSKRDLAICRRNSG